MASRSGDRPARIFSVTAASACGISVVRRDNWINILAAVQQGDKMSTELEGTFSPVGLRQIGVDTEFLQPLP
jgi:hypothetical protein